MIDRKHVLVLSAAVLLAACGGQADGAEDAAAAATEEAASQETADAAGESNVREESVQEFDAPSGTYITDAGHRYITFSYSHLGFSDPHVRWDDWTGTLEWDAQTPENSSVAVTINAASVSTGVPKFDDHLRGDDFFDVSNFPEITFTSTNVERTGENTGKITGDLTIKDVTKPVVLDTTFNKAAFQARGEVYKIGFSATAEISRSEFGLDRFTPMVGDEVSIIIETEFDMPSQS